MAWKPSAIYRISHCDGWKIAEYKIPDFIYTAAKSGDEGCRKQITMAFRERVKFTTSSDPGRIDYEDLTFKRLRNVPRPVPRNARTTRR